MIAFPISDKGRDMAKMELEIDSYCSFINTTKIKGELQRECLNSAESKERAKI